MPYSEPPPEGFGQRLKRLAKEKGLTNRALAKLTGAHEVTVSRWMAGTEPELDNLLTLVDVLGVTLDELRKGRAVNHVTPADPHTGLKQVTRQNAGKKKKRG